MSSAPADPMFASPYGAREKVRLLFLTLSDDVDLLTQRERFLWMLYWFHTELFDGGTIQVFYNFTGDYVSDAIEAFDDIGAHASATVLRRACELFSGGWPSKDNETRRQQMHEMGDEDGLEQFDGQWFHEDVFGLLLEYWRSHEPAAETIPESHRRRHESLRLFVDLPLVNEEDYDRLSDRERYLWDICFFSAFAERKAGLATYFVAEAEHALALLSALEGIGAASTAEIVGKVCSYYPNGRPSSDLLERLREGTAVSEKARVEFGDVEVCNGTVRHRGREEDLFELVLHYWKSQGKEHTGP